MLTKENKTIPRRFFKAFAAGDLETLREVLSPDLVAHHPNTPQPLGRDDLLETIQNFSSSFSDQKYVIEDQVAEGDKVATRVTWRATHSGDFQGLAPTGKEIAVSGTAISRIKNGQIVERWLDMDQMGLMQQLGLIPPSGQGER